MNAKSKDSEGLALLQSEAKGGNLDAMAELGQWYWLGEEIRKDYKESFKWYKKAAKKGHALSQARLGQHYVLGRGVKKDYGKSLKYFRQSADSGSKEGQYYLAKAYQLGIGVSKNEKKANQWMREAAKNNHMRAQVFLGLDYYKGEKGKSPDYNKAIYWFKKASSQGDLEGKTFLGILYTQFSSDSSHNQEGLKLLQQAANQGYPSAQHMLGALYLDAGPLVSPNPREGVAWIQKAAMQDHPPAQLQMATFYQKGVFVPRNLPRAYASYQIVSKKDESLKTGALKNLQAIKKEMSAKDIKTGEQITKDWLKKHPVMVKDPLDPFKEL